MQKAKRRRSRHFRRTAPSRVRTRPRNRQTAQCSQRRCWRRLARSSSHRKRRRRRRSSSHHSERRRLPDLWLSRHHTRVPGPLNSQLKCTGAKCALSSSYQARGVAATSQAAAPERDAEGCAALCPLPRDHQIKISKVALRLGKRPWHVDTDAVSVRTERCRIGFRWAWFA